MEWILYGLYGILGILALGLLCLIFYGIVYAIDNWGVETEVGDGKIIGKKFEESHTEYIYNVALKMVTPTEYDDAWFLEIEMQSHDDTIEVSEKEYECCKVGDWVKVIYKHGRMTGDVYMKRVESKIILD
jgi:hypothetical protein